METDPMSAMTTVKSAIDMLRGAIALPKEATALTSDGTAKKAATKDLEAADHSARVAEAEIAKAMGYQLCQRTFPPQIMLSEGRHPLSGEEVFRCSRCKKQEPSEQHFNSLSSINEYNNNLGKDSWLAR
jgi:hypothetical protein